MLVQFKENAKAKRLEMSTNLSKTERKFMHKLCFQLGLKSKSIGKGANRRVTIRKFLGSEHISTGDNQWHDYLPRIKLAIVEKEELSCHIEEFPPTSVKEVK